MYCHLNVKTGSRSSGQSAAAKYDYISREGRYARARRDEVVHIESGAMPAFAASDARLYWAAADSHERSNGRLFRSLTAALPNSLDLAKRLELARSFAAQVTGGEMPYTLALHAGLSKEPGTPDNPHLHLVFSERVNDGVARGADKWFRRAAPAGRDPASGGARKSERTKPREWLEETRQAWAEQMNRAFGRAGVPDRVTAESHASQLAWARAAGDAKEQERLLLNPPSEHIGPAAKHRWEERSPEQKPDRYAEWEGASAAAREVRLAHARDVAEAAEARRRIERIDAQIAALEAEQRQAEATARRREDAARREAQRRREAEQRREDTKWKAKAKDRETALGLQPGGVELYLAHLADIDPKWNVGGNHETTRQNVDAALGAAESDARRQERLGAVLSDDDAAACYRRRLGKGGGRFTTADIDAALAPAEALQERVSRLRELFAAPGGDAALVATLYSRSPSWPHAATPIDIDQAIGVASRSRDRRQEAGWRHRLVLDAERDFPNVPSAAWRPAGERFDAFTDVGRTGRSITETLADRARALAIAAERPEPPPPPPGLVKRLFEWVRERVEKMLGRLRPSQPAQREDRAHPPPGTDVQQPPAAAAQRERSQAGKLVAAARAAARKWGDVPLATNTVVSVAESLSVRAGMAAAHRAVLERIREVAPRSSPATEAAALTRYCRAEKDAATDQRHQQAVREWEVQSWARRPLAGKPLREHPDPPSRRDLAAARDELTGVVRSAIINELNMLPAQRRPASRPVDAAPAPPSPAAARRDQHPAHRFAEGQRRAPVRTPVKQPEQAPATSPGRSPAPRDRRHEPSR